MVQVHAVFWQVVLVGHSAGGLSVTHAMHLFRDKIKQAIFVAATMLPFGYQSEQDIKDVIPPSPLLPCSTLVNFISGNRKLGRTGNQQGAPDLSEFGDDVYDLKFSLGDDRPPTSVALREEHQRAILYQQCTHEDSTLASILLRPWPAALGAARFGRADDGAVNTVRRVYVKTANDRMLKPEQQEAMVRRWPPSEVAAMDTDHSPFFSAPDRLFELIIKSL